MAAVVTKPRRQELRPGRPKDLEKRTAILRVAREMFFVRGLDAVTIEAVAGAARVSRMTVYGYFGDKEALFSQVITQEANKLIRSLSRLSSHGDATEPVTSLRSDLVRFGTDLLAFFIRPEVRAFQRLLQVEGVRYPKLVKAFIELGPRAVVRRLAERLRAEGDLAIGEPLRGARLLIGLFRSIETESLALGLTPPPSRALIKSHVDECVSLFLRAYAAKPD